MVARNVQIPMYQAKIPIRGGGGVIDLSSKENESKMLVAQAIGELLDEVYGSGKRQREQGVLNERLVEARIGQMGREKQPSMKIVVGNGKTWLVNSATGEKRDLGIVPPKSKVGGRAMTDIINDISKISGAAGKIPTDALEQPIIDAAIGPLRQELMQGLDLEEVEVPGEKRSRLGMDFLARDIPPRKEIRKRKRVESKVKERPPKPKEYPDAKWSKEHQMWTIVKNGRLMGVK